MTKHFNAIFYEITCIYNQNLDIILNNVHLLYRLLSNFNKNN